MVIDKRKVQQALLSKGFEQSDKGHHYFIYYSLDGKKSRSWTVTSHTLKEKSLGDARILQMAKQCGLNTSEFINLIKCPLSRCDFEELLRTRDYI